MQSPVLTERFDESPREHTVCRDIARDVMGIAGERIAIQFAKVYDIVPTITEPEENSLFSLCPSAPRRQIERAGSRVGNHLGRRRGDGRAVIRLRREGQCDAACKAGGDPSKRAKAIVEATTHFEDADVIAKVSRDLGEAMVGINISDIPDAERMQERGW